MMPRLNGAQSTVVGKSGELPNAEPRCSRCLSWREVVRIGLLLLVRSHTDEL